MHLEHVNLTVADAERSAAFYSDLLGLHTRWKGDLGDTQHSLSRPVEELRGKRTHVRTSGRGCQAGCNENRGTGFVPTSGSGRNTEREYRTL